MKTPVRIRARRLPVAVAAAALTFSLAGCGDSDSDPFRCTDGAGSECPRPSLILDGERYVSEQTLPSEALSAEEVEPAGEAVADGDVVALGRAPGGPPMAWELVSAFESGWRVWEPVAALAVKQHAGPGARLFSVERVDWPDACLGVAQPGEACAEVITPGYRIVVEADGRRVEYHTGLSGHYRIAPPP